MVKEISGDRNAVGLRFAIVVSRFNEEVTGKLKTSAVEALTTFGAKKANIHVYHVPGAFELPQVAGRIAGRKKVDAIICLGAVIRGETQHFEYVSGEAAAGISRVGIESGIPTIFGVLTTDNTKQALARSRGKSGKGGNKGREAAEAAVEMANLYKRLR